MFWFRKREKEIREIVQLEMAKVDKDFKFLQSMQKLEIKDGDIIVLRYPQALSYDDIKHLKVMFQRTIKDFGYDVRVLILEQGGEVGILREENPCPKT